ncbi:P-loop containing nucleoside triphosphate hydrolase protein [Neurospora hispaniola]|uniref:P-loop containing nucleoside triphosphate hydrolase protein n=1 Tax=Neurospora hispaniola TaxID=588809 RepID=A0AAJ0MLR9_9PEZI|nr:P-loop containing nucleoside triphosphate hydrolase protein [Neurospora hispaniola]
MSSSKHETEKGESIAVHIAAPAQPAPKPVRSSFKNLFAFTRPAHVSLMVTALCGSAVIAAGRTAYAVLLGKIFEVCTSYGAGIIAASDLLHQVSHWCLYMFLLGIGMWVVCSFDVALWVMAGELRAKTTRETLFSTLLNKSAAWFDLREHGMSSLMTAIQTQARELQMGTSQVFGFLVCDLLVFFSCIIVALYYSYKLTLVMLSTALPSALILWLIARFLDPAIAGQKRELAEAAKHATAATTAIDLVKAYNAADHESFHFISAVRRSSKYYTRQVLSNNGQMSYIKLWMMSLFVVGFYFAVVLVNREELTPGNALTTFYCALISFQSLQNLGPQWIILAKGMAAGQSLQDLVRQADPGQTKTCQEPGGLRPPTCQGDVTLSNISFAYPSSPSNLVLQPSSFHFPPGSLTFIVGRSGSGKSTLGNLLVRFYEPLTGQITVDGQPITRLDLGWVRQNITLIQQSSVFFNDSLFQNVAFGGYQPDRVTVEDVKEACSMALLQTTVAGMPQGLDTQIGPGGYSLSGGQRQRLALARAKIRDPPVLILDEITSGLDPVSRGLIMDAIRIWRRGKTTIIITHEVGCIGEGEMVYVMEGGRVVQQGHGKQLREEREGLFAGLVASADHDGGDHGEGAEDSEKEEKEVESELEDIQEREEEEESEEEVIEEATYVQLVRGLSLRGQRGSIVFPRLTFGYDPYSSADNQQSRPLSRLLGAGRVPVHHPHPHANPDRTRDVSPFSKQDDRRHSTSSIELITQTGLSVKKTRVSNARRAQHPDPKVIEAQLNGSLDSLELFFLDKLANKKQRAGFHKKRRNSMASVVSAASHSSNAQPSNKQRHSVNNRLPSLSAILRTVWPTLDLRSKLELFLGVCLGLVVAAANPLFSYVFAQLLSSFWSSPSARLAAGSKYAGILAAIACVDALATFGSYYFLEKVATKWVTTLRSEAMTRILAQPKAWFDKSSHSPAKIVACLDRNAEEMRKLVGMFLPILIIVCTMITVAIVWALTIQWDLTLVTLAGIPAAVITGRLNALFSDKWESRCDQAALRTGQVLTETFGNIKVVRALTLEGWFTRKYEDKTSEAYQLGLRRATYVGLFFGLNQSIAYYLTAMIFYYGAKILSQDRASVTDLLRVINLILFSLGTCVNMLANVPQIAAAKATATQMLYFANLSHSSSHESQGSQRISNPLPIRMQNLRFAYPSAPDTLVLRNLNLTINPGTCTAIVGSSGCGKSTIASLLLNLYPPSVSPSAHTNNSLTFNSIPSSQTHTPSLRSCVAYIPQHPFLLPTTLRENILYGLPDSSPLRLPSHFHCLVHACQLASIHDFIISLPAGYDTVVGEGSGLQLSGGQAQRVSIARTLVRSPKVVVADEPTASLDAEGAEAVREVFARLVHGNRTGLDGSSKEGKDESKKEEEMAIVVVTHSKEMMRIADRVVMIEGGMVVEEGGYDELRRTKGGRFAGLVSGGAWDGGHGAASLSARDQQEQGGQDRSHRHRRNVTLATLSSSEFGGSQSVEVGESSSSAQYHQYERHGGRYGQDGVSDVSDEDLDLGDEEKVGRWTGDGTDAGAGAGAGVRVNEEALQRLEGTSPDSTSSTSLSSANQSPERGRRTERGGDGGRSTWGWRFD